MDPNPSEPALLTTTRNSASLRPQFGVGGKAPGFVHAGVGVPAVVLRCHHRPVRREQGVVGVVVLMRMLRVPPLAVYALGLGFVAVVLCAAPRQSARCENVCGTTLKKKKPEVNYLIEHA